jgi:hypothetical protein
MIADLSGIEVGTQLKLQQNEARKPLIAKYVGRTRFKVTVMLNNGKTSQFKYSDLAFLEIVITENANVPNAVNNANVPIDMNNANVPIAIGLAAEPSLVHVGDVFRNTIRINAILIVNQVNGPMCTYISNRSPNQTTQATVEQIWEDVVNGRLDRIATIDN